MRAALGGNGYTSSRQRLFRNDNGLTWYVWGGDSVIAEYTSAGWGTPLTWTKSYIYAGSRLLMTAANNGAGGEALEFHHPDRLGTRLVTNNAANTSFEQSTLPFGTAMPSESTGFSNQVFTSYDRSPIAGLDYAVNRTYSPGQGRFTQVDPIGMASVSLGNPQSLNLFSYVQNSPTDLTDPSGLCPEGTVPMLDDLGVMQCVGVGPTSVDINIGDDDREISVGGGSIFNGEFVIEESAGTEAPTDGGGGGKQPPTSPSMQLPQDRWWGYNNRDFQNWVHQCKKRRGDPDFSREQIQELYNEWQSIGSPSLKNGDNCNGPRRRGPESAPKNIPLLVPSHKPFAPRSIPRLRPATPSLLPLFFIPRIVIIIILQDYKGENDIAIS